MARYSRPILSVAHGARHFPCSRSENRAFGKSPGVAPPYTGFGFQRRFSTLTHKARLRCRSGTQMAVFDPPLFVRNRSSSDPFSYRAIYHAATICRPVVAQARPRARRWLLTHENPTLASGVCALDTSHGSTPWHPSAVHVSGDCVYSLTASSVRPRADGQDRRRPRCCSATEHRLLVSPPCRRRWMQACCR